MNDRTNGSAADPAASAEPILRVGAAEVTPGQPTTVTLSLANRAARANSFALSFVGVEPSWINAPAVIGPVDPGQTIELPIGVLLPAGYPASQIVGSLSARAVDGDPGAAPAAAADLVITVGDGSVILASLEPAEAHGWFGGRFSLVLRNRGAIPAPVELSVVTVDKRLAATFEPSNPVLAPGRELKVATKVRVPSFFSGAERRRPFGVRVQGRSTPIHIQASLVQRPLLSAKLMKLTAFGVVGALWIATAIVGIGALSSHLQKQATAKSVASEQPLAPTAAPAGAPGAGPGGAGGPSAPGSATSGPGGAGSSAGGTGSGVRVGGTVSGVAPGEVTVSVQPTSLANANTSGASAATTTDAVLTAAVTTRATLGDVPLPDAKVYGTMVGSPINAGLLAASGSPTLSTVTSPDGSWAIGGLHPSGTYLVTFSKPGFGTKKFVVTTTAPGTTLQLNAAMVPGSGSISGSVLGPLGHLGGVTVTLTDGTVTLSTLTPTTGSGVGDWSLTGLTTPDSYLVTATKAGYGTETTTVTLAASASESSVNLRLRAGVAAITGKVVSSNGTAGIGGVTVSATNGGETETVTTTTVGDVGDYTLSNLPIPGTYALTVSGPGWVTQTQKVDLSGNRVVGASLVPSGAEVIGFAKSTSGAGLGAAGVILSNADNTFKTLTQSTTPVGSFDFSQVPVGTYVLTVEDYGYKSASAQVVVGPGAVSSSTLTLETEPPQSLDTASVQGTVMDLFDAKGLANVPLFLDGSPAATSGTNGDYQLNKVAPGVHTISAQPLDSSGFESASIQVNVPLGGIVTAPPVELPMLDSLSGTVTSAAGTGGVSGASVALVSSDSSLPVTGASGVTGPSGTVPAPAVASTTTAAGGAYSITNLRHGNYQLQISASGYVTQQIDVSLALDQNLNQNIALTLAPAFNVVAFASSGGSSGGISQTAGICVTVTGSGYSQTQLTSATSPISFTPLVSGQSYTATFWQPSGTATGSTVPGVPAAPCPQDQAQIGAAPPGRFTAAFNNAAIFSAILAPQLPAVDVTLTYQYELPVAGSSTGTTVDCPVTTSAGPAAVPFGESSAYSACPVLTNATLPSVSITGIVGYGASTNGTLGTPVISAPIHATAPLSAGSNVWTFSPSALNALIANQVTLTVSDGSGPLETVSNPESLSQAGTANLSFILKPNLVQVAGTIPTNSASIAVDPDVIPVNPNQNSLVSAQISVSDSSGNLVWGDTQAGSAQFAQPGVYRLTATATGYQQDAPVTVPVGVNTTPSPPVLTGTAIANLSLNLTQETTLSFTDTGWSQIGGSSPPTVSLLYNNQAASASNPSGAGSVAVTDTNNTTAASVTTETSLVHLTSWNDTATFTFLSPSAEANPPGGGTGYTVEVIAGGYQTYFAPLSSPLATSVSLTPTAGQLVEESVVTGTVQGVINDPSATTGLSNATSNLAGVSVTATIVGGSCSGTAAGAPSGQLAGYSDTFPTARATTAADGTFALTGNASIAGNVNDGLCPGATYNLSASLGGYTALVGSTVVKPGAGAFAVAAPLVMDANAITQSFEVAAASGSSFASNALPTVTITNALGTAFQCQEVTTTEPGGAPADCVAPSGSDPNFSVTVFPTVYTYTISAPNFQPLTLSNLSYSAGGASSTLSVTLQSESSTVTGTVKATTPVGTPGPVPVSGLSIVLLNSDGSATSYQATTNSSGVFSIPGVFGGEYYALPATGTGYQFTAGPTFFSTTTSYPAATIANLTVAAPNDSLTVTVTTTGAASELAGTSVNLVPLSTTPASPPVVPGSAPSCASGTGGSGGTTVPLLASGLGGSETGAVSLIGASYETTIANVVPDYYTLVVTGPAGLPAQTAETIEVCPSMITGSSTTVTASFNVVAALPGAPSIDGTTPGASSVVLTWTAPASDGGSPITSYTVAPTPACPGCTGLTVNGSPAATMTTVDGLTNGTSYTFQVTATNGVGSGPPSASSSSVTPFTTPAAPMNVAASATGNSGELSLTWTAPASDGGSPVTSYTVAPTPACPGCTGLTVNGSPPAGSTTVDGLTNGTSYTFNVTATNAAGAGTASSASSGATPGAVPAAPMNVAASATGNSGELSLTWTAPASDGGSPVTSYTVAPTPACPGCTGLTVNGSPPAGSTTVDGLTNGTSYTFTVTATNSVGTGSASTPSSAIAPDAPPGTPTNVVSTVTATPGELSVTWSAPSDNGDAITSYTLTPSPACGSCTGLTVSGNAAPASTTIDGLTSGTNYTFKVTATNSAGTSSASSSSDPTTPN